MPWKPSTKGETGSKMVIIDANVWVSYFLPSDAYYTVSHQWMRQEIANNQRFLAPTLLYSASPIATVTPLTLPTVKVNPTNTASVPRPTVTRVPNNTPTVNAPNTPIQSVPDANGAKLPPGEAKKIIANRADETVKAIKNKDFAKLSSIAHPDKGIRFSPYAYVEKEQKVFTSQQVKALANDKKSYLWGGYDGTGDPINLTFAEYYKRFIYRHDYANVKQVGYNQILSGGNTIDNSVEFYGKNAIVVEYYSPDTDINKGYDWGSLRLIFEEKIKFGIWSALLTANGQPKRFTILDLRFKINLER
jgi:hypothetical protein